MGNVSSRPEDGGLLLLRDQQRLSVTNVRITTSKGRVLYSILPNTFPATRYLVKRESDEDLMVEYVQDAEQNFLLKLRNDEDIFFYFTFQMRQEPTAPTPTDTIIKNLTFTSASTPRDLDTLITREFNADPNLHKNPNVDLVGDYSTEGNQVEQFEWAWKWRPSKPTEDKGGGWRSTCSFVEYDQRAHRLNSLVTFSFWVHNMQRASPNSPPSKFVTPRVELTVPNARPRIPSSQSIDSRLSDSDTEVNKDAKEPPSPISAIPEYGLGLEPEMVPETFTVDINTRQTDQDVTGVEDGPLFRTTMRQLESKTGTMKSRMKTLLKRAQSAKESQTASNIAYANFLAALRETASSNANAVKPAIDHYFEKIAKEISMYEEQNAINLQRFILDPLTKIYNNDIKQSESKKKDFDDGSREYYTYVRKYLGQRQGSLKGERQEEKDTKYQNRRKDFELKRFDYSSFMQDLHGGRKDQEMLSQLTKYADAQARSYLASAKKVEAMIPQLEALSFEVKEADKQYQLLRTKSEERRRAIEKGEKKFTDVEENVPFMPPVPQTADSTSAVIETITSNGTTLTKSSSVSDRTSKALSGTGVVPNGGAVPVDPNLSPSVRPADLLSSSPQSKFKGIRELDTQENSPLPPPLPSQPVQIRKEGLLWSMGRPGGHADPKALNKNAWHKYWIVLDQGKLSEYINWKQNLEPHMDPIDLRVAAVREARNAERRFCFEVITPNFTRVYQATGEDDMKNWIQAINNALQTAFETRKSSMERGSPIDPKGSTSIAKDLFGKSSSFHGHRSTSSAANFGKSPSNRHSMVGEKPVLARNTSVEEKPARLLNTIRAADAGNAWCADCGSDVRVDWVSINLGIIVCIECSGIHRSLGTHITKIRSLTLDTSAFTQDVIELIISIGNRVSNMAFEATLDRTQKPAPNSAREQRQKFIQQKYVDRAFVQPLSAGVSQFHTADETLLASIKRNDIQNVLYALALGANPNAHDRVRSTHAVFLAVAAADPASPSQSLESSRTSSGTNLAAAAQEHSLRKSFPVAELLLQNGADVPPASTSPIPLSRSAQLYLDFKLSQRIGVSSAVPSSAGSTSIGTSFGVQRGGSLSSSSGPSAQPRDQSLSSTGSAADLNSAQKRERDRLSKRNSGQGMQRFMGRTGM